MPPYTVLRRRADFLRLRKGRRRGTPAFLMQSLPNGSAEMRVGFTVTKKIGNAVCRNRIKRRFREAVRQVLPEHGRSGMDYILIARPGAAERPFDALLDDLRGALIDRANG